MLGALERNLSFGWLAVHKGTTTKSKPSKQRLRYDFTSRHLLYQGLISLLLVTPLLNMGLMQRGWLASPFPSESVCSRYTVLPHHLGWKRRHITYRLALLRLRWVTLWQLYQDPAAEEHHPQLNLVLDDVILDLELAPNHRIDEI